MTKTQEIRKLKKKLHGLQNQNEGIRDTYNRLAQAYSELRDGAFELQQLTDTILAAIAMEHGTPVEGGYKLTFQPKKTEISAHWTVSAKKSEDGQLVTLSVMEKEEQA